MKTSPKWIASGACLLLGSVLATALPAALTNQDHEHDHGITVGGDDEGELPEIRVPLPGGMDDAQEEMIELFGRVERSLRRIDVLLTDAGAGDTEQLALLGDSGLSDLLNRSLETGRETIKDIDRILEIAVQMGQEQQSECPDCASGS